MVNLIAYIKNLFKSKDPEDKNTENKAFQDILLGSVSVNGITLKLEVSEEVLAKHKEKIEKSLSLIKEVTDLSAQYVEKSLGVKLSERDQEDMKRVNLQLYQDGGSYLLSGFLVIMEAYLRNPLVINDLLLAQYPSIIELCQIKTGEMNNIPDTYEAYRNEIIQKLQTRIEALNLKVDETSAFSIKIDPDNLPN